MMIAFDMRYCPQKPMAVLVRYVLDYFLDFMCVMKMRWIHDGKNGVARTHGSFSLLKVQVIPHEGI